MYLRGIIDSTYMLWAPLRPLDAVMLIAGYLAHKTRPTNSKLVFEVFCPVRAGCGLLGIVVMPSPRPQSNTTNVRDSTTFPYCSAFQTVDKSHKINRTETPPNMTLV